MILDRSGSMQGLERDTIGGFNAMLRKKKREPGQAFISTILFDDRIEVGHNRIRVDRVQSIIAKEYYVRGCTALLDAVDGAIDHIGSMHKSTRPKALPAHTLFVITTDGLENAGRRYPVRQVREMIQRQQRRYGWEFLFLGANIDAVSAVRGSVPLDRHWKDAIDADFRNRAGRKP